MSLMSCLYSILRRESRFKFIWRDCVYSLETNRLELIMSTCKIEVLPIKLHPHPNRTCSSEVPQNFPSLSREPWLILFLCGSADGFRIWYIWKELNLQLRIRSPVFYPLNYKYRAETYLDIPPIY